MKLDLFNYGGLRRELQGWKDEVKKIGSALTKRHVTRRTFVGSKAEMQRCRIRRGVREGRTRLLTRGTERSDWLPRRSLKTCQVSHMRSYLVCDPGGLGPTFSWLTS